MPGLYNRSLKKEIAMQFIATFYNIAHQVVKQENFQASNWPEAYAYLAKPSDAAVTYCEADIREIVPA